MNIKLYTDLEQSKKLAEILPLESADMYYHKNTKSEFVEYPHFNAEYKSMVDRDINYNDDILPCWSLAALINVLPDTITSNDGIAFKLNIEKNIIEYSNPSLYLIYKSVKADNPVDACVAMIEKLHELNLL